MKKQSDLFRLMGYAGNYRYFTYASWVLSAVSALVALVPFVYIWKILRNVLNAAPDYAQAVNIPHYGWMAVLFAWRISDTQSWIRLKPDRRMKHFQCFTFITIYFPAAGTFIILSAILDKTNYEIGRASCRERV